MRAIVIDKPGKPDVLILRRVPMPVPKKSEVLIRVRAAGVNRPDIIQREGKYQPPEGAPAHIPGLEVSGIIEECGAEVTRFKKGDEIVALLEGGGYAEFVTVNAGQCLPMPQNLNYAEAASLPETIFTVWHNVFQRGRLARGEKLLVHGGSSGIGITAIQLAQALGANVYTTAGSKQKCDACVSLGAAACINYKEDDFEAAFQHVGIDVVLDMIGGDYVPKNIRLLNDDGRYVFINAMRGRMMELDILKLMQKRFTITGSTLRGREAKFKAELAAEVEKHVWPLIQSGKFVPVIYKTFPLEDAKKAHELMESSTHIGKIVLV